MKNSLSYSFGGTTCDLLMTDHQGSILALYKPDFTTTYTASYDVWGRRTVTKNNISFQRGYTGHEHWNSFQLIDMNGRFYDPILARFLSPDPYVQAPDNTQSFNRYSYCLNNPLKYTIRAENTGEW
ncbi:MAG: hypothetical protein MJZ13_07795 [Bacteroidales bacterium]|nr:hypothetical protein [Bacteroidales bacterium]